jgi:hypothetical protein
VYGVCGCIRRVATGVCVCVRVCACMRSAHRVDGACVCARAMSDHVCVSQRCSVRRARWALAYVNQPMCKYIYGQLEGLGRVGSVVPYGLLRQRQPAETVRGASAQSSRGRTATNQGINRPCADDGAVLCMGTGVGLPRSRVATALDQSPVPSPRKIPHQPPNRALMLRAPLWDRTHDHTLTKRMLCDLS